MKNITDEKELLILEIVSDSEQPIGSWNLVELLEEKGISLSPATIGRTLNKLESLGYLEKQKFKGRVITPKGEEAMKLAKEARQRDYYKKKLDDMINTKVLNNFLMVLEARKAIERTTARLAAMRISDEEIKHIEDILKQQDENYRHSRSITQNDLDFHKAIAKASRNTVLDSLYRIVSMSGQQSELFEYIRKKVGAPYMHSHNKIFEAIRNHDSDAAEMCMVEHIESLSQDVNNYWHEYYSENN